MSKSKLRFETASGIALDAVYRPDPERRQDIGLPGEFPYTRGIQPGL